MQTFITDSPEVAYGLEYLDRKRLVKQLLETRQIMAALAEQTKGWVNHPATKMWRGKETLLHDYAVQNAMQLHMRGYKFQNNLDELSKSYLLIEELRDTDGQWGDEYNKIVYTHRGRLFEKDPEYYAQWSTYTDYRKHVCCERCNYYWPTHLEN
jgi:hypothetical protein